jgi:beta-lactamase class A
MESNILTGFQVKRQRKKRKKCIKILLFTFITFIGTISLFLIFNQFIKNRVNDSTEMTSPFTASVSSSPEVSPIAAESIHAEPNSLKDLVDDALEGTKGTYGIAITNLKTGEAYYAHEHKIFETGSLYKLWIMATVYKQIQNGQLQEDQVLSEDVDTLNEKFYIASDSAEQTEGTITFTVHDALSQMITISDNYAALLLTEKIRLSSVATFLKENGFTESLVGTTGGSPTATPYDIALFFEKLYKEKLANQEYTNEMINLLKDQQLNDGLPKYLPDTSQIANKTGEIDFFKHDAGIVFTDKGDYIIVVMSESDFPLGAQERIALVSKGVFDYFTNK